jgi:hypothetical protein
MATIPSRSNISYPTEIKQRFLDNRKTIVKLYKELGKTDFMSYCNDDAKKAQKEKDINKLIDLGKKLETLLCIINREDLLFKLHARKLILDEKIVLHLTSLPIKLKD